MQIPTSSTNHNVKQLGERIRNWRKTHRFVQKNLAERAKIVKQVLARIGRGNPRTYLDDILSIPGTLGQEKKMLDSLDPPNDPVPRFRWESTEKEGAR